MSVYRSRTALTLAATLVAIGALAYVGPRPGGPAALAALNGSWPTLWFAMALVLAGTALAHGPRARRRATAAWSAVALATEAVQHPTLASLFFPDGPTGSRFHPATYAHLGTFDPLDVAAALLGAAIGGTLALAFAGTVGALPRGASTRRTTELAGRGALLAAAVTATLATTAVYGPWVSVTFEPSVVCEGDEVQVAWTGHDGGERYPERGVLSAVPSDAFIPPIVELDVEVPGTLDVVAVRSGWIDASPSSPGFYHAGGASLLHARPCDAAGRQYRNDVARDVVALAVVPGSEDVVAALVGSGGRDLLVRLDSEADEVATTVLDGDRGGFVRDLAVAPDGTVVAVGWRASETGESATEAVAWRWPVGGASDAGTVVGPVTPGLSAEGVAVAIDATGRTWIAWTEGPPGDTVALIARYAPDGTPEATGGVPPAGSTEVLSLTVDDEGRPTLVVQVAGNATTAGGRYVHALDGEFAPRWERGPFFTNTTELASTGLGTTLFLVHNALHALDDATGTTLWTTALPEGRFATHLDVDDAGAPVVAGLGTFLQRYSLDGAPSSGRTFGSARSDRPGALVWSGGAVVAGSTEGALATTVDPGGLAEAFVLRFPEGAP